MKFSLFLIALLFCSGAYSQPTLLPGGETKDLKDCVTRYTTVYIAQSMTFATRVSTDDGLVGTLTESETGKKILFTSYTKLFNYMDKWGWRYVDKIEDPLLGKTVYLFEKKEK